MESTLGFLLRLLDGWPGPKRVTPDDLRRFGPDETTRMEAFGVLVAAEPVGELPASCGCCDSHPVVRSGFGGEARFAVVCAEDGLEWVAVDRLRSWTIDFRAIADGLASAIDDDETAETILPGEAWRIGGVVGGEHSYSIVLASMRAADRLAERRDAERMILLTNQEVSGPFAATLRIENVFDLSREDLRFRRDRIVAELPIGPEVSANAFYRNGQFWVVRFGGEETFLENNVGVHYLARLLATPNASVPAITLLASRAGIDERKLTGSSGELADAEAVADCRRRYDDLMAEIATAESDNDIGRLGQLRAEQDELTSHLASVLGKGGRRRDATDADKIRQSVTKAIKRTLAVLDAEHKPLAEHLSASLSLGYAPMYSPAVEVDWQT
ncbi:hypothetical protein [Crateriforma spongiae]|uniref:hypothetical protein n=1 Tax=Crateriforma spongiae TaxID=2724528 RepID=UPI0039AF12CC